MTPTKLAEVMADATTMPKKQKEVTWFWTAIRKAPVAEMKPAFTSVCQHRYHLLARSSKLTKADGQSSTIDGRVGAGAVSLESAESINSNEDVDDDDVEQFHGETEDFPENLGGRHGALDGDQPVEERFGFLDVCLHGDKIFVHSVDHVGGVGDGSVQLLKNV